MSDFSENRFASFETFPAYQYRWCIVNVPPYIKLIERAFSSGLLNHVSKIVHNQCGRLLLRIRVSHELLDIFYFFETRLYIFMLCCFVTVGDLNFTLSCLDETSSDSGKLLND